MLSIISNGDMGLWEFLKCFGLCRLILLNVFLLLFFCYLILLSEGYDKIVGESFVLCLKYINLVDGIWMCGKFVK